MEHLTSPNKQLAVSFSLADEGSDRDVFRSCPLWSVAHRDRPVLLSSRLGLRLDGAPTLLAHFRIEQLHRHSADTTWRTVCGEHSEIRDHFNELEVALRETIEPYRMLILTFRAYDNGAAFRYTVPELPDCGAVDIWREETRFRFPPGCDGWVATWAQGDYTRTPIQDITEPCERPLLVRYPDDRWAAVGEAGQYDYPRMRLQADDTRMDTLGASLGGQACITTPWSSPWRYIIAGDRASDIPQHNDLPLNLAPPNRIADTRWIVPGKAIRETTLSTEGAYRCVDFAVEHGIRYVLFDGGWYGHPLDESTDATSPDPWDKKIADPANHPGLDMASVISYAAERSVGIWLYVDQHALERQLDRIVTLYSSWGVVGIKFGFVHVGPQRWSKWLIDAVQLCAEHRLMVDIHDEFRSTGMQRTWPNLLNVEGVGGNEMFPTAEHNTTLPFTRFVDGPADYTICIYSPRLKRRRTHQLAMSVCYFAPIEMVYWYDTPQDYQGEEDLEFLDQVPTVWDETIIVDGTPGEYVVTARRSGSDWYVGVLNNEVERDLMLSFSFLRTKATAVVYRDSAEGRNAVIKEICQVGPTVPLTLRLLPSGGAALRISSARALR